MKSTKNYSFWSLFSTIIGFLILIVSYLVTPDRPEGFIMVGLQVMTILAILLLILGILVSIIVIKQKEKGLKKYVGIILPV